MKGFLPAALDTEQVDEPLQLTRALSPSPADLWRKCLLLSRSRNSGGVESSRFFFPSLPTSTADVVTAVCGLLLRGRLALSVGAINVTPSLMGPPCGSMAICSAPLRSLLTPPHPSGRPLFHSSIHPPSSFSFHLGSFISTHLSPAAALNSLCHARLPHVLMTRIQRRWCEFAAASTCIYNQNISCEDTLQHSSPVVSNRADDWRILSL